MLAAGRSTRMDRVNAQNLTRNQTFPFLNFCARSAQTQLSSVFHVISCNKKMVVTAERSS